MNGLKYPWQSLVLDAAKEGDQARLIKKSAAAQQAIAKRLRETNDVSNADERVALEDSKRMLASFRAFV